MKTLDTMTSDERNLLLYFETCAVDYGGKVDNRRMNKEDMYIAEEWNKEGFVKFGRIKFRSIISTSPLKRFRKNTHWCELSDEAWDIAHEERKARCARIMSKQTIDKTSDRSNVP
ncbi:hypothetical protein ES703_29252 [subsurface metagenome]